MRILVVGLALLFTVGPAFGQSHTYVLHGKVTPGATTYSAPRSVNATGTAGDGGRHPSQRAGADDEVRRGPRGRAGTAQPRMGQHYEQIYYGDDKYMAAYRRVIGTYNPSLSRHDHETIVRSILYYSYRFNIDPRFVVAVVANESRFRPHAISSAGAQGLGQLMPGTAASLGVDPHIPYQNIQGTVRYLKLMLDRFKHLNRKNQMRLALASYNAGYGAVQQYGGVPPYAETQNYVEVVMAEWRHLSGERL